MKWPVKLLAATTLVFAASTGYFARLLQLERERAALIALQPMPPAEHAATAMEPRALPELPGPATPVAPVAVDSGDAATGKKPDPGQIAVKRHRLDELRDPAARAARARQIAALLREDWQSLAPDVGIAPSGFDQFIDDMTERSLQRMQRLLECEVDPACNIDALKKAPGMSQDEMTAAALGPDRYARFKAYQETGEERSVVAYLGQQLPATATLSDAAADNLIRELGGLRAQFTQDAQARGEKVDGESSGGMVIRSAATAGAADEFARRRDSATEYVRRATAIASSLLKPEQLALFRQSAQQALYTYTERMREAEIARAARAAAGNQP